MTRAGVPLPPAFLRSANVFRLPAGSDLHRLHAAAFRPAEFNPCKGQPSRFAPFTAVPNGACVPTLYAATSREAAAFESIFHDIEARAKYKAVNLTLVETRAASVLRTNRDLVLASLFAPDLMAWGLRRNQLIDTPKSSYAATAQWARVIHHSQPQIDGLVWTSRQCDPELCIIGFGDRLMEGDLDVVERREVAFDPALLLELRDYARRAGIVIVS